MSKKRNRAKNNNYGLTVTGQFRVFKKQHEKKQGEVFENVWGTVSNKKQNGDYINQSLPLKFGKDEETPDHNSVIKIIEAFPIIDSPETKYQKVGLFVKDWDYADEE